MAYIKNKTKESKTLTLDLRYICVNSCLRHWATEIRKLRGAVIHIANFEIYVIQPIQTKIYTKIGLARLLCFSLPHCCLTDFFEKQIKTLQEIVLLYISDFIISSVGIFNSLQYPCTSIHFEGDLKTPPWI